MIVAPHRYSRAELETIASQFYGRYASCRGSAVDFEFILEKQLGVDIVPRDGLLATTGAYGYLTWDLKTILVDAAFQRHQPLRYNDLLGHETGHRQLHAAHRPLTPPASRQEFAAFHEGIGEIEHYKIEWEATTFCLYAQMPTQELRLTFSRAVEHARDRFPNLRGPAELFVHEVVGAHFGVDAARVGRRLQSTKLWERALRSTSSGTRVRFGLQVGNEKPPIGGNRLGAFSVVPKKT